MTKEVSSAFATEIAIKSSCDQPGIASVVCIRGGTAVDSTEIQVKISKSCLRTHRKNKDRRGTRWMRGRLLLDFQHIDESRIDESSSGEIKLQAGSHAVQPSRRRGRMRKEHHLRSYKPLRGIPFNYQYRLNRLFLKLSVPKHRRFEDVKLQTVTIQDNGNQIPLSVAGISTALTDSGYSQRDFVVGAKVVLDGEDVFVQPTLHQERMVDLTRIGSGQGVLMLEYCASSNRIAHIFTKGQLSSAQFKKALTVAISSCQSTAESTIALLRKKYDNTLELDLPSRQIEKTKDSLRAVPNASLKFAFKSMLTTVKDTGISEIISHSTMEQVNISSSKSGAVTPTQPKTSNTGKKLSLADLAKRKKKN